MIKVYRSSTINSLVSALLTLSGTLVISANAGTEKPLPVHPSAIKYDSLNWAVPLGKEYRLEFKNGAIGYVASDKKLPIIQISGFVRYGNLLDPAGKEGLSSLMTTMMRNGGTQKYPADTLDDLIDLYGMDFNVSSSESQLSFSASFLSEYKKQALDILQQILFKPAFDPKRFDRERSLYIESIRHRFDNPGPILGAGYRKNMYTNGKSSRLSTEQSIKGITRDDLVKLHAAVFHSKNIICAVAGDFDRDSMVQSIETLFPKDTTAGSSVQFPPVAINQGSQCLFVHKPLTQAYVRMGFPLFQRPNPDYYAASLLNEILGGGGFTSRLGTTVRSDAGLTYSINSIAESNYMYPATFFIDFFTKNQSFSQAVDLTLQEVKKIVTEKVTQTELDNARASLLSDLPSMFRSPADIVSTYCWNEYYGRPETIYRDYPEKLKEVTVDQVLEIAKKYLDTSKMAYTVVGDSTALRHQKSGTFSMDNLKVKMVLPDSLPKMP